MKTKTICSSVILILMPIAVFAQPGPMGPCKDFKPTEAQGKQIQNLASQFEKDSASIEAELKVAFIDRRQLIQNEQATQSDGEASSAKIAEIMSRLGSLRSKLENTILFTVFDSAARPKAAICLKPILGPGPMPGAPHGGPRPPRGPMGPGGFPPSNTHPAPNGMPEIFGDDVNE